MAAAVYIVMATTGEYDEQHVWPVRAFADERLANAAVAELKPESARKTWKNGSTYFDPDYWVEPIEFIA